MTRAVTIVRDDADHDDDDDVTITRVDADYDVDDDDDDCDDDGVARHRAARVWFVEGAIEGDSTDELDDAGNAEAKDDGHGNESQGTG